MVRRRSRCDLHLFPATWGEPDVACYNVATKLADAPFWSSKGPTNPTGVSLVDVNGDSMDDVIFWRSEPGGPSVAHVSNVMTIWSQPDLEFTEPHDVSGILWINGGDPRAGPSLMVAAICANHTYVQFRHQAVELEMVGGGLVGRGATSSIRAALLAGSEYVSTYNSTPHSPRAGPVVIEPLTASRPGRWWTSSCLADDQDVVVFDVDGDGLQDVVALAGAESRIDVHRRATSPPSFGEAVLPLALSSRSWPQSGDCWPGHCRASCATASNRGR